MLYVLKFKKGVAHISIRLYRFSMHQILKMKLARIEFIEKTVNAQLPDHLKDPELFELVNPLMHNVPKWSDTL